MCIPIIITIKTRAEADFQKKKDPVIGWAGLYCSFVRSENIKNWYYWTVTPSKQFSATQNMYQKYDIWIIH